MPTIAAAPSRSASATATAEHDVAIVGSGFSGLAMAVRLKRCGHATTSSSSSAPRDVGGTWRDNTYPGCACDVPSHLYSFSFAPNPEWSSTFSPQPEIQDYLRGRRRATGRAAARPLRLRGRGRRVGRGRQRWRLETSRGPMSARVLIAGAGPLSEPKLSRASPGSSDFEGTVFHSAAWDHDHDLTGERVAVIGTGARAIQFVPQIQPRVGRAAPLPAHGAVGRCRAATGRSRRFERALYRRVPGAQRLMRAGDLLGARAVRDPDAARVARAAHCSGSAARHLRRQVADPELRAKLTPDYAPGCKRILISNDYLPALAQPNVEVVTDGIAEVRERSIVTADGSRARGRHDHLRHRLPRHRHADRRARPRRATAARWPSVWDGSPRALPRHTVAGFPNLFFLLGPEHRPRPQLGRRAWPRRRSATCSRRCAHMRRRGAGDARGPRRGPATRGTQRSSARMEGTVWTAGGCASWYIDRTGRNTTLWPGFTFRFRRLLRRFDAESYVCAPPVRSAEPAPLCARWPSAAYAAGDPTSAPSAARRAFAVQALVGEHRRLPLRRRSA